MRWEPQALGGRIGGVACREGKKMLAEEMRKGNENFSYLSEILTMPALRGGGAGGGTGDKEERKKKKKRTNSKIKGVQEEEVV